MTRARGSSCPPASLTTVPSIWPLAGCGALEDWPNASVERNNSAERYSRIKTPASLFRISVLLLLRMTLQRQLKQAINQVRIANPGRRPQLRVHADRGKAGHGVDLIY